MKKLFSLITALVLCTAMWGQMPSSYYELPDGAFVSGLSTTAGLTKGSFYLPHIQGGKHVFSSSTAGVWVSTSGESESKKTYSYNSAQKKSYHTPQIVQEGKKRYQYGATDSTKYDETLYFYVGDSAMRYMTPAKFWADLTSKTSGQAQSLIANYKTTDRDVMGVYFNNIDVMYIDGLSIPISSNTKGQTVDNLFPDNNAHVIVNIYKATTGGKTNNKADRDSSLWTGTLTKENFSVNKDNSYRGALNVTFDKPIIIEGSFVVELSDMKNSGCFFYVYSANVKSNQWGYYLDNEGVETYPGAYTLGVSVHAMFPSLYPKDGEELDMVVPSIGVAKETPNGDTRFVRSTYANMKYNNNKELDKADGWDITLPKIVTIGMIRNTSYTKWYFTMSANTTDDVRTDEFIVGFRGKKVKYTFTQAPMLKSITLSDEALSLEVGKTATLVSTALPVTTDQDTTVTWTSSNEDVATVDANGVVTAVAEGKATITATSTVNTDFTATCEVTVIIPVTYYAENNWNGATEWSWLEMSATDQENIYMLDSVVFGGTGVNINDKEDDTDALSFDTDKIVVLDGLDGLPGPIPPEPRKRDTIPYAPRHSGVVLEAPQLLAGDTIKLFFNAADSTLKAFIIGRPAPVIEYKYTTYTEWQVKQDEISPWGDMTKQEDGTFTIASVWYNLGLYIASGENPIKQDWYPLDDEALTVAEDVAESDNVVITLTVKDDETVALNVKKQTATNINNVKAAQGQRYNILGQSVDANYRGIVIMNGKTYLQ